MNENQKSKKRLRSAVRPKLEILEIIPIKDERKFDETQPRYQDLSNPDPNTKGVCSRPIRYPLTPSVNSIGWSASYNEGSPIKRSPI